MQQVPIQQSPNQQFTIILDNNNWEITLKTTNDVISASLSLNTVAVIENLRVVAGYFLIPSQYEEAGNFIFTTADNQLPDYTQFNVTQGLIYISAAELEILRAQKAPPITASNFNPLGALPLRFKPQGYRQA